MLKQFSLAAAVFVIAAGCAVAKEYPVGAPQNLNGMEIGAVYLQPIEMEPAGMMTPADQSDVHLEADIHATKDNKNGFAEGDWIPNLVIAYKLTKLGSGETKSGSFMKMVANDGPHYGDNVKLMGAGKYELELSISTEAHFGRHVDKETGVGPWPAPFAVKYDFTFAGIGKKGSY